MAEQYRIALDAMGGDHGLSVVVPAALEALKQYLSQLEKAVIVLLFFIAFKLGLNATDHIWHHGYSLSATTSLYVVLGVLALGILASVIFPEKPEAENKES